MRNNEHLRLPRWAGMEGGNMEQCEGQITITELLKSKISVKSVMDLTGWINSHGEAQYTQIKKIIRETCADHKMPLDADTIDRMTNAISVYVLEQATGYMDYLEEEAKG